VARRAGMMQAATVTAPSRRAIAQKRQRIEGTDAEEESADQASEGECSEGSGEHSGGGELQTLREDEA